MKNGLFDSKLYQLYKLIFKDFKFSVENDALKVFPPSQLSDEDRSHAKNFIQENKEYIEKTIKKNNLNVKNISTSTILSDDENFGLLSFSQERLWFIDQYEGKSSIYNVPLVYKIIDDIDLNVLEKSISYIVERHEPLRSLIKVDENGGVYQQIVSLDEKHFAIEKRFLETEPGLYQSFQDEIHHFFSLNEDYPIKVTLHEFNGERYISIVVHHIAFDGWSIDIFLRETQSIYQALLRGDKVSDVFPSLTIQYKDFGLWQRAYLEGEVLDSQLSYWKSLLEGYENLNLQTDRNRANKIDYRGARVYFLIDLDISNKLRKLARSFNISLFSLLLSGYYLLLACYSNQSDIVVGIPVANRHYPQVEKLIGFFVNNLALRTKIDRKKTLTDFIRAVGKQVIESQDYQDLPFEKLVDALQVDKDISRHPIFQVFFSVQSFGQRQANSILQSSLESVDYQISKFDITTTIDDSQPQLTGEFNYAVNLFNQESIEGYIKTYKEILAQLSELTDLSEKRIADIYYQSSAEHQIIDRWNGTTIPYPSEKTLHQLFQEQVVKTPDAIAILFENKKLTYCELNERANQLAHFLRSHYQIDGNNLIALCLDRSELMLIGILAVLKAGGAYIPIDPEYPDERINYILKDTKPIAVIANAIYTDRLKEIGLEAQLLMLDSETVSEKLKKEANSNIECNANSKNLAYVIYTSGTTGVPKGVLIEHIGVVNYLSHQNSYFGFKVAKNIYLLHSYAFDTSISSIFGSVCFGHCLVITKETDKLDETNFSKYKINVAYLPPALLSNIDLSSVSGLEIIVVSGEKSEQAILNKLSSRIINEYGPTEASVCSTFIEYDKNYIRSNNIGTPIGNKKLFILNDDLQQVPIGVIGELYIGGTGLARGYLNRPDLTAERFIDNPFATEIDKLQGKNLKIYKTGDLVRWLSDGNIEYLGRIDDQVKIRGFRIELGEVQAALSRHDVIKQAIVIALERNNTKQLVAYYVSDENLSVDVLRNYLKTQLPEYMIPAYFVALDSIPLTANGKVDKRRLPDPDINMQLLDDLILPQTEVEKKIARVWRKILNTECVGINNSFFNMGGNSLLTVKMCSELKKTVSDTIRVIDIFKYPTIYLLAKHLQETKKEFLSEVTAKIYKKSITVLHNRKRSDNTARENNFNEK